MNNDKGIRGNLEDLLIRDDIQFVRFSKGTVEVLPDGREAIPVKAHYILKEQDSE